MVSAVTQLIFLLVLPWVESARAQEFLEPDPRRNGAVVVNTWEKAADWSQLFIAESRQENQGLPPAAMEEVRKLTNSYRQALEKKDQDSIDRLKLWFEIYAARGDALQSLPNFREWFQQHAIRSGGLYEKMEELERKVTGPQSEYLSARWLQARTDGPFTGL
ncbi:MAG TPA: hypothetical protein VI895_08295 [Bdellovibrionota bacterium]|nr:hypothetical protein [Bdellovibrionota bacterium]